jgi:phosphoenolpyruvate phosphomutase|tara:strand:- start:10799 stop:11692 length:894 start_codon:yes stop_codon:yes gene_type:complete
LNKSKNLIELLNSKDILKVGGAFDAMSAKLVEINDFDAIWAGSFAISATHALPDASILTMTEFLHASQNMAEACNIPVIADCDTGFGGPKNVSHLVKKYEKAGISGISIEDKIFPKENSLLKNGKNTLISEKEFVAKIIAAREAKVDNDFLIIARTEALIAEQGIDEAIKRALAYEKAGADAILIHSKKDSPDEVFEFADSWGGNIPLVVVPTTYPDVTIDDLVKHKIKIVIYANQSLRAAYSSMNTILSNIKNGKLKENSKNISSMEDIFQLQKMYEIKEEEKEIQDELQKMGYID